MALVPHHPPHLQPRRPGAVGQPAGVGRVAATAWETDVDVDHHLSHATGGGGVDGGVRVDGQRHARLARVRECSQTGRVDDLVGEKDVVAEPGPGQPLGFADGGAREPGVAHPVLPPGQGRALVRLHVRP